ncbi:hypothetical protein FA95DRAFT_1592176 [Auriscalpium vulgare]|uniref:Uncharacterized protein n=1 Tax=Auriscalpium vulgare TaxID=40419 RepID=A0ACB8SB30_9AGAM|nr:hypothetical protein FA95DRAFT_1592176 [Auriscalpium vulgare]
MLSSTSPHPPPPLQHLQSPFPTTPTPLPPDHVVLPPPPLPALPNAPNAQAQTPDPSPAPAPMYHDDAGFLAPLNPAVPPANTRPRSRPSSSTPGPVGTPKPEGAPDGVRQSQSQTAGRPPDGSRQLNVTDALSYLDAVKMQFQDKPDVYNDFLDIMKEFKHQLIDTPGVIERVSTLFHGNPYLIEGFNTFLPPGYHINASTDPRDPNLITVTTPLGTMTSTALSRSGLPGSLGFFEPPVPPPGQAQFTPLPPSISRPSSPRGRALHPTAHAPYHDKAGPEYSPGPPSTTAAASVLGNMGNKTHGERPSKEFDHAIQYLNKIKTRYPDDPNTYKQFLEILQTYRKEQTIQTAPKGSVAHTQREQRMMHDVYMQVQVLFKDADDILGEFKDFLGEINDAPGPSGGLVGILPHPPGPSSNAAPSSRRRKRDLPKETGTGPKSDAVRLDSRKRQRVAKLPAKGRAQSPTFNSYAPPSPPPAPPHNPHQPISFPQSMSNNLSHLSQSGLSMSQIAGPSSTTQDELMFFDRAKRHLEARDTYDDFLKVLNMYSKDIIDLKQLVTQVEIFLGDGELLVQFKNLLSWDDKKGNVEYGPPGSIRTGPPDPVLPRPVDDGQGPSYRRLPEREARLATSGRDQLARTVLNDEWVSHPTWASEEAGFLSHKKNSFEEVIHRCEDERHEYQIQLEGLSRTIAILEPLNARLDELSHEDRAQFKLKPNLGGQSRSLYMRTLKKVYGKDAGMEIYQALQDAPSVAVPVVLTRLKQKNEEWRRAQREWALTWRQIDGKNFYKSLDHMGINFKANDKKNITTKAFVTEIEGVKAEQEQAAPPPRPCTRGSLGFQLDYSFADTAVLHDSLKLVYSYLDHNQATYSLPERRSVERFLRAFVPTLCMYPLPEFNAACGPLDVGPEDDSGDEPLDSADAAGGVHAGDLRKKLLRTAQEKAAVRKGHDTPRDGSPNGLEGASSRVPSPEVVEGQGKGAGEAPQPTDVWIRESLPDDGVAIRDETVSARPFFANTTFYTLLRLLQLLYSRLSICKEVGAKHVASKFQHLTANPIANELGLEDSQGPSVVLDQILDTVQHSGHRDANVLYSYMLDVCEKLFDNDMDQSTFEEHMRWFFGTKAFLLYTVDKIIASLIKQVQAIVSDGKCQELWQHLRRNRGKMLFSRQDIIRYRRQAEHHVGSDDNLYRDAEAKTMRIQLVGTGDASVDEGTTAAGRWREYVDSYVTEHPTEWLHGSGAAGGRGLVKRHLAPDDSSGTVRTEGSLGVRVSLGTYKLFYEGGSGECLWRERGSAEEEMLRGRAAVREEERTRRATVFLVRQI